MKTEITHEGQSYFDEPKYVMPKSIAPLEKAIADMAERDLPAPILTHYERVRLRWMKPDGKGGLVPK